MYRSWQEESNLLSIGHCMAVQDQSVPFEDLNDLRVVIMSFLIGVCLQVPSLPALTGAIFFAACMYRCECLAVPEIVPWKFPVLQNEEDAPWSFDNQ